MNNCFGGCDCLWLIILLCCCGCGGNNDGCNKSNCLCDILPLLIILCCCCGKDDCGYGFNGCK